MTRDEYIIGLAVLRATKGDRRIWDSATPEEREEAEELLRRAEIDIPPDHGWQPVDKAPETSPRKKQTRFSKGDFVMLNSGGPLMWVKFDAFSSDVNCEWADEDGELHCNSFSADSLRKVRRKPTKTTQHQDRFPD